MTTTTRDAFEVWFAKRRGAGMLGKSETGGYEWVATSEAAEVWQAATEAEREKRQPLTAEYVCDLWRNARTENAAFTTLETYTAFASAIEAAHGIKQ